MIAIESIRNYYMADMVFASAHAMERFRQRGIRVRDVREAIFAGEIIEQYPEDYPYPSCLILGKIADGRYIHVVVSDEGSASRIITAYFPDPHKWENDLKTRKA